MVKLQRETWFFLLYSLSNVDLLTGKLKIKHVVQVSSFQILILIKMGSVFPECLYFFVFLGQG